MCAKVISIRTGNCCLSAGWESYCDIFSFYENENMLNIKGIGSKTRLELSWIYEAGISLLSKHERNLFQSGEKIPSPHTQDHDETAEYLKSLLSNDFKRKAIHEKYEQLIQAYPIRSQIWLNKIPLDLFIAEYLCCHDRDDKPIKMRHVYVENLPETADLKDKLTAEIARQFYLSEEDSVRDAIFNHYGLSGSSDFPVSYYLKNHCFPMFWILEKQLDNYDDRDMEAFKQIFQVYQNQRTLLLAEFAARYSISRERVRQICNQLFSKIFCSRSLFFKYRSDWNHYRPLTGDTIWEKDVQKYIDEEQSSFSTKFVIHILFNLIYSDRYTLYGKFVSRFRVNNWKHTFLVNNRIASIFDFEKFRMEINDILLKNKTTCLLDIEKYIAKCNCWIKNRPDEKNSVTDIVRNILVNEFQLHTGADGNIEIAANIKKTLFDVMYEILKNNGNPMHLSEIFSEFKRIMPEHYYDSPIKLRHYLLKNSAIACQNRKSVYVLKEWTHVKSGTIRDSIVEFLSKKRLPQTALNITDYVLRYFPGTNILSVRTSMFNDTKQRFVFFKGGLFGLMCKKYPLKYKPTENTLPSFADRLLDMERFLVENRRFPFASSKNRDERILGVWWARVIKGIYKIDESRQNEVKRIRTQYAGCEENKRFFQWNKNCDSLKRFLLENRRLPSVVTEKFLYHWLKRAKNDFLKQRMNEQQLKKYLELAMLIEK
jgi:hypothetical protein